MEKELQLLDKNLFDKRRKVGTACVLLHGQPGGGKSHLARQYVYKNRRKFQCGIFWIQSKSREEREQAFWNIHQKVLARESPEACISINGMERYWIAEVKAWFEARHDWLIVFDGLVIDRDEDTAEIQDFVPDSTDSSIIYISRAKNLESKQRLLRPFPIKVPPLRDEDARKLLFKTQNIKEPSDAEVKSAKAIVKQVGGLPLAIDAISHRLADTNERLPMFSFKSYSADPKMRGTYNKILDDLQRKKHMEAWNLINILCFYGQHIPVEMVHLGLKALRSYPVEVMTSENGGKPDFNTTIGILRRYALVERNEPDDKDSFSSSQDSFSGPEPIDMFKIHSVVQKFCCDSLNASHILPEWLGKAVRVFVYSYHQAKQKLEPGPVSDYRYYLVHGQQLWDHSKTYESRNQPLSDIRKELDPVLEMIKNQIRNREPTSSQENVIRDAYQASIFDRTNSTSESGPSMDEAQTPEHRLTALPLGENEFGIDIRKPSVDSPASLRAASPNFEPRIAANSPRLQLHKYYDIGYESDREPLISSVNMQKSLSEATTRPRGSTGESHGSGWQVVASNRKIQKPKQPRRDLGTFRPTPAEPKINMKNAKRLVSPPSEGSREQPRSPRSAFALLSEVQHRSPPRTQDTQGSSWRRRIPGLTASLRPTQPTYAGVLAGQRSDSLDPENARPSENIQPPLTSEKFPPRAVNQTFEETPRPLRPSEEIDYTRQPQYTIHGSTPSLSDLPRPRQMKENLDPNISYPQAGYIHTLFPEEEPLTSRRPFENPPQTPRYVPYTLPSHSNHSSRSNPPPQLRSAFLHNSPPIPSGYYSQPMSRHESHHSHPSLPETEPPLRFPPSFSPRSDRHRFPDGQPPRKSPKTSSTDYPMPNFPEPTSPHHNPSHELSGTGGWAYPSSPPDLDADLAMSRSSSGPGFRIGDGLGIVQFGEQAPVNLEDARRRNLEYELRLRREDFRQPAGSRAWSEERGRGRGRSRAVRPYPDLGFTPGRADPVGGMDGGRDDRMDIG